MQSIKTHDDAEVSANGVHRLTRDRISGFTAGENSSTGLLATASAHLTPCSLNVEARRMRMRM